MYVKPVPVPPGTNPALEEDRIPVVRVVNGDTWTLEASVVNPVTRLPATDRDTVLKFVLAENRFTAAIWTGSWHVGIEPSDTIRGLVRITVPKEVSDSLRRGVYAFSLLVTDDLGVVRETQLKGHFQVEYEPTSVVHNIPYRSDSLGGRADSKVYVEE